MLDGYYYFILNFDYILRFILFNLYSNRTKVNDITVGLGVYDVDDPNDGYIVPIDKMILHENFTSNIIHDNNDIALIKLKNVVEYNAYVQPICFPNKGKVYFLSTLQLTTYLDMYHFDRYLQIKRNRNTLFVVFQFILFYNNR